MKELTKYGQPRTVSFKFARLARSAFMLAEHMTSRRASEASETLLVVVQWKTQYVYTYIYRYVKHTFVARSWGNVMWEELSVSHF